VPADKTVRFARLRTADGPDCAVVRPAGEGARRATLACWLHRMVASRGRTVDMRAQRLGHGWWTPLLARDVADPDIFLAWTALKTLRAMLVHTPAKDALDVIWTPRAERIGQCTRWLADTRYLALIDRIFGKVGGAGRLTVAQRAAIISDMCDGRVTRRVADGLSFHSMRTGKARALTSVPVCLQPLATLLMLATCPSRRVWGDYRMLRRVFDFVTRHAEVRYRSDLYADLAQWGAAPETAEALQAASHTGGYVRLDKDIRPSYSGVAPAEQWFPSRAAAILRLLTEPEVPPWLVVLVVRNITVGFVDRFVPAPALPGEWPAAPAPARSNWAARHGGLGVLCNVVEKLAMLPVRTTTVSLDALAAGQQPAEPCRLRPVLNTFGWSSMRRADAEDTGTFDSARPADRAAARAWRAWMETPPPAFRHGAVLAVDAAGRSVYPGSTWPVWPTAVVGQAMVFDSISGRMWDGLMAEMGSDLLVPQP